MKQSKPINVELKHYCYFMLTNFICAELHNKFTSNSFVINSRSWGYRYDQRWPSKHFWDHQDHKLNLSGTRSRAKVHFYEIKALQEWCFPTERLQTGSEWVLSQFFYLRLELRWGRIRVEVNSHKILWKQHSGFV